MATWRWYPEGDADAYRQTERQQRETLTVHDRQPEEGPILYRPDGKAIRKHAERRQIGFRPER